jgi:3D (Asp-Asp-Asp) domain-containing protein
MLRKYNIIINVAFWLLVAVLTTIFSIIFFFPGLNINTFSFLFGEHKESIVKQQPQNESEPIVVTELKEVRNEIEWYHFVATAYSKNDAGQGTDNLTATGKVAHEGIIAVDPEVVPYGTAIEIKDMGYFVAEDCGGKIKGNRIDIYFDSKEEAESFGRQDVWIRFLPSNPLEIVFNK